MSDATRYEARIGEEVAIPAAITGAARLTKNSGRVTLLVHLPKDDIAMIARHLRGMADPVFAKVGVQMERRFDTMRPAPMPAKAKKEDYTIATEDGVVIAEVTHTDISETTPKAARKARKPREVTPAPKPARKARTKKVAPEGEAGTPTDAPAETVQAGGGDYAAGYNDGRAAFAEDTDEAYVAASLRDAHAFYTKRAAQDDATGYVRGMAAALAERIG